MGINFTKELKHKILINLFFNIKALIILDENNDLFYAFTGEVMVMTNYPGHRKS